MSVGADSSKVVLHPLHAPGLADSLAGIAGTELELPRDDDEVTAALERGAAILVTYRWEDRFLAPSLRWVQAISAGIEQFPVDALRQGDVRLTSARGAHAPAVAEHAIALLFALVRRLGEAMRDIPDRGWAPYRGAHELAGQTLGIIGLGSIGEEVAERAVALGMHVIGSKRHPAQYTGVAERVFGPEGITALCREADAVVVALPHADDTAGVLGWEELAALRDGWLVNVGRGSVIDQRELIDALRDGTLRGAGLDVFDAEPLPPDSPLWDLPNVVITPHSAWETDRLAGRLHELFAHNLAAYRSGSPWRNVVV